MIPTLHIHLLGDFLLTSGDTPITAVALPRLQSLLAYLVLHRAAPQDRSHLAFLLWPDSTEAQAHTNLRKLLYQLRQALPNADRFIYTDKHSVQWLPTHEDAPWTLDIQEVEQALAQAEQAKRASDTVTAQQVLEHVLHLYRGDLLPTCYDEWILPERDRLHQLFITAAERLIAILEQERDYTAAITIAQQLLRHEPLHEATYRQLIRLYALRGDRAAALRAYHTCARLLEAELGTEPSEATRSAYESLMQVDTSSQTPTGPLVSRRTEAPLIGRKTEWRQLQEAWRTVATGQPHVVLLSGEAGIGKTRLAEEMEAWVSRQGMTTASAHCYSAEGRLAYAPVATWLRTDTLLTGLSTLDDIWLTEVARLVPDMLIKRPKLPRPAPMTEEWQRQHYFEALAHALSHTHQPLLLLLDDLQWCDNETLEWLHYLLRFEPTVHLLLVGTVRSDEIRPDHPLVPFLHALQRNGIVTEIALKPLTTPETATLVEHIAGHRLDTTMIAKLYAETEGNPLFVVEMARMDRGDQSGVEAADQPRFLLTQTASRLPATIQTVLAARLAQLSPLAREVANVAAVIGRAFAFTILARASSESEDTVVRGLDELWQRRIVREQDAGIAETYDFSHDKLREQAYLSLSPAHRRLLHRHVAEALEELNTNDLDIVSAQLAAHYEQAALPAQAMAYYQRAGETALRVYANADAITAFQRAVALLEAGGLAYTKQEQPWELATQIYTSLGNALMLTGKVLDARQAYEDALAYVPEYEYIWYARLWRYIANTWQHTSDNPQDILNPNAYQAFQKAEHFLEQASAQPGISWQQEWIEVQLNQLFPLRASADEMTVVIEKVRPFIEQYGSTSQCFYFCLAETVRDVERDHYIIAEKTVSSCRHALTLVEQISNPDRGFAHFALGICLMWSGHEQVWSTHLDEAEEHLLTAIRIGEQVDNAALLMRSLTFLSLLFRRRGRIDQVRTILQRISTKSKGRKNSILAAQQAWLAWRDGNLSEAVFYGRASLEERPGQQRTNAFHWIGVWPLIGVALVQEKLADAMHYVYLLLDPSQQLLPAPINTLLQEALQAWDMGHQEAAKTLLQQAASLAQEMNYL